MEYEFNNLYSSLNIVMTIKSWRVGWTGHVARAEEIGHSYKISAGKPVLVYTVMNRCFKKGGKFLD
jgi:hypothetical protein